MDKRVKPITHGYSGAVRGCECEVCISGRNEYQKARNKTMKLSKDRLELIEQRIGDVEDGYTDADNFFLFVQRVVSGQYDERF